MITKEQAKIIALQLLKDNSRPGSPAVVIADAATREFEYGWMFFYQSERYLQTLDLKYRLGGNAPIIVDKLNSSAHFTGTRLKQDFYIDQYCKHRDTPDKFYQAIR